MRKLKNNVFMVLALLPLITYILTVFRSGEALGFLSIVEEAFGNFGGFFVPLITPLFSGFVDLADTVAINTLSWFIGYYVVLLLAYLVYCLFTFMITLFMDKMDHIRGGR